MALDKKIVKDSGLSVSYFRILNIEVNYVYDIYFKYKLKKTAI